MREEALDITGECEKKRDTTWTDGSRLDDKRVGAAVVWWEAARKPQAWQGANPRDMAYRPDPRVAMWVRGPIFARVGTRRPSAPSSMLWCTHRRSSRTEGSPAGATPFLVLRGSGQAHPDGQAWPWKTHAIEAIETAGRPLCSGNKITPRWTPWAH